MFNKMEGRKEEQARELQAERWRERENGENRNSLHRRTYMGICGWARE